MMYAIKEQIAYGEEKSICQNFLWQKYLNTEYIRSLKNN